MNKKILTTLLGIFAITSCSTINNKNSNDDLRIKYINSTNNNMDDITLKAKEINGEKPNYLTNINKNNFIVKGDKLYKGEELRIGDKITNDVILVKAYSKHPKIVLKSTNKDYEKYKSIDGVYNVVEKNGEKEITFLNENVLYLLLADKYGNEKEIMLDKTVELLNAPELKNGIRYKDLKKGIDNRITYQILTNDGGYEETEDLTGFDKYKDLDDYVGKKTVKVKDNLGNLYNITVDFGYKLEDFYGRYEDLLIDLNKSTLKFSKDGNTVEGGFNPYYTEKIKEYEKSTSNVDSNLEFVTEILDGKKNIGNHKIVRKIIKDGTVIFEKEDYAHITFPGTSIGVMDESFDVDKNIEKRLYRLTRKEEDKDPNDEKDVLDVERWHGTDVIGAAIDEVYIGNGNTTIGLLDTGSLIIRAFLNAGYTRDFSFLASVIKEDQDKDDQLIQYLQGLTLSLSTKFKNNNDSKIVEPLIAMIGKLSQYEDKKREISNLSEPEKTEALKNYYLELYEKYENLVAIPDDEKVEKTDLHFYTISLDTGYGLSAKNSNLKKYLPKMLEENRNIRAVNMSYGSDYTYDEYVKLLNMTEEDIKKATEEYNKNPLFRFAIQNWLDKIETPSRHTAGFLNIPSMAEYFKNRPTITARDYKKIVNLRLLLIKDYMKQEASELSNGNQDVLFVVSQGNTLNNANTTDVDLTEFDEDGRKVIFKDGDRKYNNSFSSAPLFENELLKQEAKENGFDYKYTYGSRKNILGVIGMMKSGVLNSTDATEDFSDDWVLNTQNVSNIITKLGYIVSNLPNRKIKLMEELEKIKDDSNYEDWYKKEILSQLNEVENLLKLDTDPNGRPYKMSFTRAGKAKLWTVASEGMHQFVHRLTDEEKRYLTTNNLDYTRFLPNVSVNLAIPGSSFAAPRITAIAGEIGSIYPWMTSQQIKQTILTTATDDMRIKNNKRVGLYGVDEELGWGIANRDKAYLGPARFVKALTHETGDENFIANIPYGNYKFSNDIEGGFDLLTYAVSRKIITEKEYNALVIAEKLDKKYVLSAEFDKTPLGAIFEALSINKNDIYTVMQPKVQKYYDSLPYEDKELFKDAGLVKEGLGTLMLEGNNTYKEPTIIKEGTLILTGTSESPFYIEKNGKLKLDMKEIEDRKNKLNGGNNFVAKINADVVNKGELYSYSVSDRINGDYKVYDNSKTYIAANAKLDISKMDLSNARLFDFNIFRKKGMLVFETPKKIREGESVDISKNYDEKEILNIQKISKLDATKIEIGSFEYTPYIDLVVEKKEIEGDSENISIIAKLVRKNKVHKEITASSELLNDIEERILISSDNDIIKLEEMKRNLYWQSQDEDNKLNGETLANSMLLGYELLDLKNDNLLNRVNDEIKINKFDIFANVLSETKFFNTKIKGSKNILINGTILGGKYNYKYGNLGLSFNYTNSILKDYNINLESIDTKTIPNDLDEKEKLKRVAEIFVTKDKGNVYANNYGLSLFGKLDVQNIYLSSIFNFDYINKKVQRNIGNRKTSNSSSTDAMLNLNLQLGYKIDLNKLAKIKENINITPYLGVNLIEYIKGSYLEDNEFGYSSDQENIFKSNMSVGIKVDGKINKNLKMGGFVSYTGYLTDTLLKDKSFLTEYKFERDIRGTELENHYITYGMNLDYKVKNIELNVMYKGKNILKHSLSIGLNYEF